METNETGAPAKPVRMASLDVFRGTVMFLMMAEILRFGRVAAAFPENAFWGFLARQQSHVEWAGCTLHDLIQPSFSFLVGAALPFSLAARSASGQSPLACRLHAFRRAAILILLGVFLRSHGHTNWTFEDTLTQIGLGYGFLFLLAERSVRAQWIAFFAILVAYWLAFALYPLPGPDFHWSKTGSSPDWEGNFAGFAAHWNKNANFAWAFDRWFLNLFPRPESFAFNGGGYSTASFAPTLATMILGLIAGGILKSDLPGPEKLKRFVAGGAAFLFAGWLLGRLGICPVVKRIWTPSWTLFSGGWCLLFLAGFHFLADLKRIRRPFFPFAVLGVNSIAAYCIDHWFDGFVGDALKTHLGADFFKAFGAEYEPLFFGAAILFCLWLILLWMDRRRIHIRI